MKTLAELRAEAKAMGIKGYSRMNKEELNMAVEAKKGIVVEVNAEVAALAPVEVSVGDLDITKDVMMVAAETVENKEDKEMANTNAQVATVQAQVVENKEEKIMVAQTQQAQVNPFVTKEDEMKNNNEALKSRILRLAMWRFMNASLPKNYYGKENKFKLFYKDEKTGLYLVKSSRLRGYIVGALATVLNKGEDKVTEDEVNKVLGWLVEGGYINKVEEERTSLYIRGKVNETLTSEQINALNEQFSKKNCVWKQEEKVVIVTCINDEGKKALQALFGAVTIKYNATKEGMNAMYAFSGYGKKKESK